MDNIIFLSLYFIFALLNILVIIIEKQRLQYIFKPLLIPLLIMYYIFHIPLIDVNWFIVAGLTCGLIGNVFFMHLEDDEMFYHGLLVHGIGYVFYVIAFLGYFINFSNFQLWKLLLFAPGVLIVLYTFYRIKGGYELTKIVMFIYISVVLIMHFFSIFRLPASNGGDFWLLWIGTFLLLLTSGLIALNKFTKEVPYAEALILGIFYFAQFFIIQGAVITTLSI